MHQGQLAHTGTLDPEFQAVPSLFKVTELCVTQSPWRKGADSLTAWLWDTGCPPRTASSCR